MIKNIDGFFRYLLYITAFNRIGTGLPCDIVTAHSKGTGETMIVNSILYDSIYNYFSTCATKAITNVDDERHRSHGVARLLGRWWLWHLVFRHILQVTT